MCNVEGKKCSKGTIRHTTCFQVLSLWHPPAEDAMSILFIKSSASMTAEGIFVWYAMSDVTADYCK